VFRLGGADLPGRQPSAAGVPCRFSLSNYDYMHGGFFAASRCAWKHWTGTGGTRPTVVGHIVSICTPAQETHWLAIGARFMLVYVHGLRRAAEVHHLLFALGRIACSTRG